MKKVLMGMIIVVASVIPITCVSAWAHELCGVVTLRAVGEPAPYASAIVWAKEQVLCPSKEALEEMEGSVRLIQGESVVWIIDVVRQNGEDTEVVVMYGDDEGIKTRAEGIGKGFIPATKRAFDNLYRHHKQSSK